jgi:hypothetical protein
MEHRICRVVSFEKVRSFVLRVSFDDETTRVIDVAPVLRGELFGPLSDPIYFDRVRLDEEAGTLVWPNGADFDPATLRDWPLVVGEMAALASRWEKPVKAPTAKKKTMRRLGAAPSRSNGRKR